MSHFIVKLLDSSGNEAGAGCWIGDRWVLTAAQAINFALGREENFSLAPDSVITLEFSNSQPGARCRARVVCWSDPLILDAALLELIDAPPADVHPVRPLYRESLWSHTAVIPLIQSHADVWVEAIFGEIDPAGYCPLVDCRSNTPFIWSGLFGIPVLDNSRKTELVGILVTDPAGPPGGVRVLCLKALLTLFPQIDSLVRYPIAGMPIDLYQMHNTSTALSQDFVAGSVFNHARELLAQYGFVLIAGAAGTGRHSLAYSLLRQSEPAYVFPAAVSWSEVIESGVNGAGLLLELEDQPRFALLKQLLRRGNHIILVTPPLDRDAIAIFDPATATFLDEQFQQDSVLELDQNSYSISEKEKIVRNCLRRHFEDGSISKEGYEGLSGHLEHLLSARSSTSSGQASIPQKEVPLAALLERQTPGEIHQWIGEQLIRCATVSKIDRAIRRELRKGSVDWLLDQDISLQIFLLAACVFEAQPAARFWSGYQDIVHSLRGLNLNLAILPVEIGRNRLPGILRSGNLVHFTSPSVRNLLHESIGCAHQQVLQELLPLFADWTLATPGQPGYLEQLITEPNKQKVDELVLSSQPVRKTISELIAIAAARDSAPYQDLIETWGSSPDARVRWAAESAWFRIVEINRTAAFSLLNRWCSYNPNLIYLQVTVVRILLRLVKTGSPGWESRYAIQQLSGIALGDNGHVLTELVKNVSHEAVHIPLSDILPVLHRLIQSDLLLLHRATAQILITYSRIAPDQTLPVLKQWAASFEPGYRRVATYVFCACWEIYRDSWRSELEAALQREPLSVFEILSSGLKSDPEKIPFLAVIHQLVTPTMLGDRDNTVPSVIIEALTNSYQTGHGVVQNLLDQIMMLNDSLANQIRSLVLQRLVDRQAEQYVLAWQAAIIAESDRDPYDLLRVMKNNLLESGQNQALLAACRSMAGVLDEGSRNFAIRRIVRACALDPELLDLLKKLITGQSEPLFSWLVALVQGYDALVTKLRYEYLQALKTNPERAIKIVEAAFGSPGKRYVMRDVIWGFSAEESSKIAGQSGKVLLDQPNLPDHLSQWREIADQEPVVEEFLKLLYQAALSTAGQASRNYDKLLNMDGIVLLDMLNRLSLDSRYNAEVCNAYHALGMLSRGEQLLPGNNRKRQFIAKLADAVARQYNNLGIEIAGEALKFPSECEPEIPGFQQEFQAELSRIWKPANIEKTN